MPAEDSGNMWKAQKIKPLLKVMGSNPLTSTKEKARAARVCGSSLFAIDCS